MSAWLWMGGCSGGDPADGHEPPGPTDTAETGTYPWTDTGTVAPQTPCTREPCVADLAWAHADGDVDSWFGYDLSVVSSGGSPWLVAGAPGAPGAYVSAGVHLLALPDLGFERSWYSEGFFDSAGLAVASTPADRPGPVFDPTPRVFVGLPHTSTVSPYAGAIVAIDGGGGSIQDASSSTIDGTEAGRDRPWLGFHLDVLHLSSDPGVAELIAAAPGTPSEEGQSALYAFPLDAQQDLTSADALRKVTAPTWGLTDPVAWDTNGDGVGDLAASYWLEDGGEIHVFEGPWASDRVLADSDVHWTGGTGLAVDLLWPVGDLDGDGLQDLGVGSNTWTSSEEREGGIWVLGGGSAGLTPVADAPIRVVGSAPGAGLGSAMLGMDVNADGAGDLVAGASGIVPSPDPGRVLWFAGPLAHGTVDLESAAKVIHGEFTGDSFGIELAHLDVDEDARDDLVVSATNWNGQGRVYVLLNSALLP
jgi:hypothetical protein